MKNERVKSELTELLYDKNGYVFDFDAEVIDVETLDAQDEEKSKYAIILDRTAFFTEEGRENAVGARR